MARIREYSPSFDEGRLAAPESFFVDDVRSWVRSRFNVAVPAERTAVCGVSQAESSRSPWGFGMRTSTARSSAPRPEVGYRPPAVMPSPRPRTYLVAGTLEPWFLENATRWADAMRDAPMRTSWMTERIGDHGDPFWQAEFPLMVAWRSDAESVRCGRWVDLRGVVRPVDMPE